MGSVMGHLAAAIRYGVASLAGAAEVVKSGGAGLRSDGAERSVRVPVNDVAVLVGHVRHRAQAVVGEVRLRVLAVGGGDQICDGVGLIGGERRVAQVMCHREGQ